MKTKQPKWQMTKQILEPWSKLVVKNNLKCYLAVMVSSKVRHWNIYQVGSNYVLLSEKKHKERQMYRQKKYSLEFAGGCVIQMHAFPNVYIFNDFFCIGTF